MNHQSPQLTEAFKLKGYLDKKSSQFMVGWQSRYWAVVGIDLLYYQDNTEKDIKGKFMIKKMQSIQQEDKKILTFLYDDRKYELKAPSGEDRDRWLRGLRAIKKYVGDDVISEPNSPVKLPHSKSSSSLKDFSDLLSVQQEAYIIISQQMQECKSHSDVIKNLGLKQIASKFSTKKICNRIAIAQTKDSYLIVFSCKSLIDQYEDGEILSQQQVNPFQLNTLYRVKIGSQKVKEVCKTSSIFSVQYDQNQRLLKMNCGKRLEFLLKDKDKTNKQLPQKLKKAAEIGRQYHNTKNISLNANIGPLLKLYEINQGSQLKQKVKIYLQNKYATLLKSVYKDYTNLQTFSDFFQQIVLFQKDYLNAFEVSNTKNSAMISDFEQFIHNKIHRLLTQFWDQRYQSLSSEDILQFARTIDEYRRITSKYVKDQILDNGVGILVKIYLRSLRQRLMKQIQKLRNSLSSASFSSEVYNFLYRELSRVVSHCQSQQALTQVVEFMDDCYKIWIEEMTSLTEKQGNPQNLVFNLAQISDFNTKVFTELKDYILNNGFDALSFDDSLNQTQIIASQKNLTLHIIQRLFKVLFSNIDRNIVSQSLMKINFQELIKEIESKVSGLKNIGKDQIRQIRRQLANQLLQFELNLIIEYKADPKDKIENIVKKIKIDQSIIEREFLKTVERNTLDKQIGVLSDLAEFLSSDSLISIRKYFKSLKKSLPYLFTLVTAKSLLQLKTHLTKEQRSKLYSVCVDILSSETEPSEVFEASKKQSMLESFALSSRRSTLTLSIQKRVSTRPADNSISKQSISGYLKKKKIDKRSIKRMYQRRYFTILQGHLLWYLNESSVQLHNKIDLKHLKLVGLHETKKDVFFLHLEQCAYQFKAESNELCKQWVRILKSYVVADRFESEAFTICDDTELFKDYDSHVNKSAPKLMRLQSTRESVLSQMSDKSKLRVSPSPSSPPKSPTKSVISKAELTTQRNNKMPFIKKESLNVEQSRNESRGCMDWFKRCVGLQ